MDIRQVMDHMRDPCAVATLVTAAGIEIPLRAAVYEKIEQYLDAQRHAVPLEALTYLFVFAQREGFDALEEKIEVLIIAKINEVSGVIIEIPDWLIAFAIPSTIFPVTITQAAEVKIDGLIRCQTCIPETKPRWANFYGQITEEGPCKETPLPCLR